MHNIVVDILFYSAFEVDNHPFLMFAPRTYNIKLSHRSETKPNERSLGTKHNTNWLTKPVQEPNLHLQFDAGTLSLTVEVFDCNLALSLAHRVHLDAV